MNFLIDWLDRFTAWLLEMVLWVLRKLCELVFDGLAFLFQSIPVPSFMQNAPVFLAQIDPAIMYFLEAFMIADGLVIMISAGIVRFVIRRTPLVG